MKKIYLLFILINFTVFSQTVEIPNLVLPSPQAFDITKFGNIPADESSGRVSPSIPIHNYTVGALQIPISLSYSGNGVKVEQKPTWTGMNWILNAGGVITRVVKDLPDETSLPRIFYSKEQLLGMFEPYLCYNNLGVLTDGGMKLPDALVNSLVNDPGSYANTADTQVDEFSFSFPGYSGSFYLKKNEEGYFEAKLLKYENELKIEILGNFTLFDNYEFKITTPQGISYYFGGQVIGDGSPAEFGYAVEETQFVDRSSGFPQYGERSKTAFYLTKVQNDLGDIIYFAYHTKEAHEVFSASNLTIETNIGWVTDGDCTSSNAGADFTPKIIKNIIYNAKFLKRIWNHQTAQAIEFNSIEIGNTITNNPAVLNFRILSDINFGLGRVDFDYIPNKNSFVNNNSGREKFFLEKVTFKDSSNALTNEKYTMSYIDPLGLPKNTFSNAQDYLGYYNGKVGNLSLLPKNSLQYSRYYFDEMSIVLPSQGVNFENHNSHLGDRSTSFAHASKGLLQKIIYPTGGSSVFEYEPIEKDKYVYGTKSLFIYNNGGTFEYPRIPLNWRSDYVGMDCDPFGDGESNNISPEHSGVAFINEEVMVNLTVKVGNRLHVGMRDYVYIEKRDCQNNLLEEKKWYFPNFSHEENPPNEFTTLIPFNLVKDQKCFFYIGFGHTVGGTMPNNEAKVEVSATFSFVSGIDENDGTGIRIKRIKDYEKEGGTLVTTKRFYYKKLKDVIKKTEDIKVTMFKPFFHSFRRVFQLCVGSSTEALVLGLNTNSFTQNLPSSDVLALYPYVTISLGGDNFEQGAIEKKFLIESDEYQKWLGYPSITYPVINKSFTYDDSCRTNLGTYNGLLLEENIWVKNNNSIEKIKKNKFLYSIETNDNIFNVNGKTNSPSIMEMCIRLNYFIGCYRTISHKINFVTNTTHDFITPVPITRYTIPPFNLYPGWQFQDHDGDGIQNQNDDEFITPDEFALMSDEEIEEPFKKIITSQSKDYSQLAGMPSKISMTNSDGVTKETRNYYPIQNDINVLSGALSPQEITALNMLKDKFIINEPFQSENWKGSEKLSTQRLVYTNVQPSSVYKYKVQTSKGIADLEDRIIYHKYDSNKNPVEISLADGTKVVYIWSYQRKPIYKIINATYDQVMAAVSGGTLDPSEYDYSNPMPTIITNPFITSLPNAHATIYNYDPVTQFLTSEVKPNGDVVQYEYDTFNRLKKIKDKESNTLKEYDYNYRPN